MNKKLWFYINSGTTNNPYVQAVINLSSDSPGAATIAALNAFFNAIDSTMSLAENIKMYALNNSGIADFQLYNFANPSLYKSIPVSSPTYGVKGYKSTGANYVNGVITPYRRSLIEQNFCSMVYSLDDVATQDNSAFFGAASSTTKNVFIRPLTALGNHCQAGAYGGAIFSQSTLTTLGLSGIRSISTTQSECFKNGVSGTPNVTAASGGVVNPLYDCCRNSTSGPTDYCTKASVSFRWDGYQLTIGQAEIIRTALLSFYSAIGL